MSSMINEKKETLYDVFHNAYLKYPNNTAVLYNCGNNVVVLTYLALMTEIEKLSEHVGRFCENCTYIGICIRNTYLAPTIILGILRVRKAYVVVGEDGQLLQRLGCSWVLAEQGCWAGAGCEPQSQLELHGKGLGLWAVPGVVPHVTANVRLAYAMQTSGTTGQPTIVQVPHSAILPNITDLQRLLQVTEHDVVYLAAPLTFDPSVVEMFLALESGAALLVAGPAVRTSSQHLLRCLFPAEDSQHPGVTVLQVTPSTLGRWLGVHGTLPRGLRVLLLGGEPCPPLAVLRQWTGSRADCRVFNVYGLTEVSCWASLQEVCWDGHVAGVPLGSPLSCTVLSVRDQAGHSITQGEGEMFVGSLERTCFIGDEEVKVATTPVFRATGDIVKLDIESGSVLYVGRGNRVIKRWGHRVDLAGVEREVRCWRADAQYRCVWDPQSSTLGLFLLNDDTQDQLTSEARWHLVRCLLPPALPDVVAALESWPLTAHGKVDDAALQCLLRESSLENSCKGHEFGMGETFTRLWHKYLGPRKPEAGDVFIDNGGNSFIALHLAVEMEKLFGRPAPAELVPMLLGGSTFMECRRYVGALDSRAASLRVLCAPGEPGQQSPSCVDSSADVVNAPTVTHKPEDDEHADGGGDCSCICRTSCSVEESLVHSSKVCLEHGDGDSGDRLCYTSCRGRTAVYCEGPKIEMLAPPTCRMGLQVQWKFNLGKCVDASPAVAVYSSGRVLVVVGSHSHKLAAVDGETGQTVWQIALPDRIESSVCLSPCGTHGIVGCYDGSVYCVQLDRGTVCWRFPTGRMVKSSPTLCQAGTAVTVGSYDYHLYCLRIQDGAEHWRLLLGASILASPLLEPYSGLVMAATLDGMCAAVTQDDGCCRWKRRLDRPVFSSPAVLPAGRVLFAEVSGVLHCLLAATGEQMWSLTVGGNVFSSPCVVEGGAVLLGCHDGSVYCVEEAGLVRWCAPLDAAVVATPCCMRGTGLVVAATTRGSVYLLALGSGALQCHEPLPDEVFSSPASCDPHFVYLGCRDNHLYCLGIQHLTPTPAS